MTVLRINNSTMHAQRQPQNAACCWWWRLSHGWLGTSDVSGVPR